MNLIIPQFKERARFLRLYSHATVFTAVLAGMLLTVDGGLLLERLWTIAEEQPP